MQGCSDFIFQLYIDLCHQLILKGLNPMAPKKLFFLGIPVIMIICSYFAGSSNASNLKKSWKAPSAEQIPFGQGIEAVSEVFLGAPFVNNVLGEGPGQHDPDPLFRLDAFDCTTFVETVWALAFHTNKGQSWTSDLQRIRYRNAEIKFNQRLHFISLDWMPYHERRTALIDITRQIGIPVSESTTSIDRLSWYRKMHPSELPEYLKLNPNEKPVAATIKFLAFKEILENPEGIPNLKRELLKGPILANFIRPNWDTVAFLGTQIDVSHQGFLILKADKIVLRHSSFGLGKVGDEDFVEYMKTYKNHATLKGIQLARISSL